MKVIETEIPDVKIIRTERFGDERGVFSETYNKRALAEAGIDLEFVQDNHSLSRARGTVRGLHFQIPPYAQDKLLRVVRGAVLDVAVDLRKGSPTFGEHVSVAISAEDWNQILVPGCREIVRDGENGLLVPVRNVETLSAAIKRLIEDHQLRRRMGEQGRKIAEQEFGLEHVIAETLLVYQQLLRKKDEYEIANTNASTFPDR